MKRLLISAQDEAIALIFGKVVMSKCAQFITDAVTKNIIH